MTKTYAINEIFRSIQGEGFWSGTPMVFVRFSGCNLDCPFCDTDFADFTRMSAEAILEQVTSLSGGCDTVCVTGGEPTLQLDEALVEAFHKAGFKVHIETNGTRPVAPGVDWITFSPKSDFVSGATPVLQHADELKLVYNDNNPARWASFPADHFFLQPCSGENMVETASYVSGHPRWRLSLQIHKLLGIR